MGFFFLFGPRGTGKTTWLKQRFPDAIYLDLLDHALYLELLARPQRLRDLIPPGYDGDAYLASYVENYLRQEVLEEGRTRNLATFSRFLESASFSQAAPLNVAEVARDVGVDRKTASAYFDLLEDLLIATRVPVFTKRAKRRMTTHKKFFLFDVGVYRAIRPAGPLDSPEQIDGPALETLVYQELRAAIAYRSLKLDLFFWRTASGTEVDLVAYGGDGLFAIEVKRTRTIRRADLHGLKQFRSDYPMARCVLLFGGDRREHRDGIELLPLAEALADPTLMLGMG